MIFFLHLSPFNSHLNPSPYLQVFVTEYPFFPSLRLPPLYLPLRLPLFSRHCKSLLPVIASPSSLLSLRVPPFYCHCKSLLPVIARALSFPVIARSVSDEAIPPSRHCDSLSFPVIASPSSLLSLRVPP